MTRGIRRMVRAPSVPQEEEGEKRRIFPRRPIRSDEERFSYFRAGKLALGWLVECDNAGDAEILRAAYPTFATIMSDKQSPYFNVYASTFVRLPFPVFVEDWENIKSGLNRIGIRIPKQMEGMALEAIRRSRGRFELSRQPELAEEPSYQTDFLIEGAKPLPFQEVAIEYVKRMQYRGIIGDDMGLGKTMSGICALFDSGATRKLVVTKNCLTPSFYSRLCQWTGKTPEDTAIVVSAEGVFRKRPLTEKEAERGVSPIYTGLRNYQIPFTADLNDCEILIVHYAILSKWLPRLLEWKPDIVVFDEGHTLCNPNSQLTQSARVLSENIDSVVVMTGTPGSNRPRELFHLFDLVFPYRYGDFHHFGLRFCDARLVEEPRKVFDRVTKSIRTQQVEVMNYDGASNKKELFYRLRATGMVRRLKKDVLDQIPYTDIPLTLTVSDRYLDAEAVCVQEVREAAEQGKQESLLAKLLQLSAEEKIEWAKEWVPTFLEQKKGPLVIFFHHNTVGEAMLAFFREANVPVLCMFGQHKDRDFEYRFQNDETIEVALISYAIGRDGLTLTRSADMLLLEYTWVPGWIDQAKDRIRRYGQENAISYYCPYFMGSTDERIVDCVISKKSILSAVLDNNQDTVLPKFKEDDLLCGM